MIGLVLGMTHLSTFFTYGRWCHRTVGQLLETDLLRGTYGHVADIGYHASYGSHVPSHKSQKYINIIFSAAV